MKQGGHDNRGPGRMKPYAEKWTLVQHPGFTFWGKIRLRYTVEERAVSGTIAKRIAGVGGVVYADKKAAQKAAYRYNYPNGPTGKLPHVDGSFHHLERFEYAVFIPMKDLEEQAA